MKNKYLKNKYYLFIFIIFLGCLYGIFNSNESYVTYKQYYVNVDTFSNKEKAFYNRIETIYEKYKSNGSILKMNYFGAVYAITYDNSGLTYDDYTDEVIEELIKCMGTDPNVPNGSVIIYNEEAFKKNLKEKWLTSHKFKNANLEEKEKDQLIKEIFDYNDFYYSLYYGGKYSDESSTCGSFSGITVNVLDAKSGNIQKTLSLDEYILGVAYGEEDSHITGDPEFGKAFFISAITFTLNRAGYNGNPKVKEFSIENSTNAQVWCDITTGCGSYGAGNTSLYIDSKGSYKKSLDEKKLAKYKEIYNSVAGNVLQTSNGKLNGGIHYVADQTTCSSNKNWCDYGKNTMITQDAYKMAQAGSTYKEILGKYFSTSKIANIGGTNTCSMSGWTIRTSAPNRQSLGYDQYYQVANYYGECVWYVRGRGQEITAELMNKGMLDKTVGNTIINRLEGVYGNAVDWFGATKGKFNQSTNYKQYKAGSIVVYDGGVTRCNGYCGHVAVIENVDQKNRTITYTEGGQSYKSNGYFHTRTFTFDEFEAYILGKTGNSLTFKGYIYFLEPTS